MQVDNTGGSQLRLAVLGPVEVQSAGLGVPRWASRRAVALVCYLAMHRQAVPRSTLVNLLWGDKPEPQGRANLSWLLHAVAAVLPGVLLADRHTVQWDHASGHWIDVYAFQDLAAASDYEAAAALVRGGFAADVDLEDSPELTAWLASEREVWQQRVAAVLLALATEQLETGATVAGLAMTQRLLDVNPYSEAGHRLLMTLLLRDGRREAAMAQYRVCEQVLAQVGLQPAAETTALFERIRSAHPAVAHLRTAAPLVGRAAEVQYLTSVLAQRDGRLITIVGPGGAGKSHMALHVAERFQDRLMHGVVFVPLDNIAGSAALVSAMAVACGIPTPSIHAELVRYLRDKEVLMVLDGFDQLMDLVDVLLDVLAGAPQVKLLVTSRERLNVRAEWLLELRGLTLPEAATAEALARSDAAQCFRLAAQRHAPNFVLDATDYAPLYSICHALAGLPLALELAAWQLRTHACADIANAMLADSRMLEATSEDFNPSHRRLEAVWLHSWQLLDHAAQAALLRLSVFRGSFTHAEAWVRAEVSLPLLATLLDKSLLQRQPDDRYVLLLPIQHFARMQLARRAGLSDVQDDFLVHRPVAPNIDHDMVIE